MSADDPAPTPASSKTVLNSTSIDPQQPSNTLHETTKPSSSSITLEQDIIDHVAGITVDSALQQIEQGVVVLSSEQYGLPMTMPENLDNSVVCTSTPIIPTDDAAVMAAAAAAAAAVMQDHDTSLMIAEATAAAMVAMHDTRMMLVDSSVDEECVIAAMEVADLALTNPATMDHGGAPPLTTTLISAQPSLSSSLEATVLDTIEQEGTALTTESQVVVPTLTLKPTLSAHLNVPTPTPSTIGSEPSNTAPTVVSTTTKKPTTDNRRKRSRATKASIPDDVASHPGPSKGNLKNELTTKTCTKKPRVAGGSASAGAGISVGGGDSSIASGSVDHSEQLSSRRLKDRERYANMTPEQRQVYNAKRREQYHRQSDLSRHKRRERERNRYHSLANDLAKDRNARRAQLERERYQKLTPVELEEKNRARRERAALARSKKNVQEEEQDTNKTPTTTVATRAKTATSTDVETKKVKEEEEEQGTIMIHTDTLASTSKTTTSTDVETKKSDKRNTLLSAHLEIKQKTQKKSTTKNRTRSKSAAADVAL